VTALVAANCHLCHRPRCRTKRYFGFGPSTASVHLEVLARNLTFWGSSSQFAAQLLVVTAKNVPIAGEPNCTKLTLDGSRRSCGLATDPNGGPRFGRVAFRHLPDGWCANCLLWRIEYVNGDEYRGFHVVISPPVRSVLIGEDSVAFLVGLVRFTLVLRGAALEDVFH